MIRVLPDVTAPVTSVIDGFGRRTTGIDGETGDEVDLLDFAPELVEHQGFVAALGERVARFAAVRHASYVHLRRLDRPSPDRLLLVSDQTPGWRLSELLDESAAANVPVDITVVIGLLRQLLPAVALFGRHNREAAIATLAPQRLIVTPQSRLVIAEHAFGPAIEKLNLGRDRLWKDFRVAMPPSAGLPRANQRADANAIGIIALSLLAGRVLDVEEYPAALQSLIEGAKEHRNGDGTPLSATFTTWLMRAVQSDVRTAFQSPSEMQLAFESVLASDRSYVTTSPLLDQWVARFGKAIDDKRRPPEPEPEPEPVAVAAPPPPPPPPEPEPEPQPEPVRYTPPAAQVAVEPYREEAPSYAHEEAPVTEPPASAYAREDSGELRRDLAEAPSGREGGPQAPYAPQAPVSETPKGKSPLVFALAGVVVLLLAAVGWLATRGGSGALGAGEGELVVTSRPVGAQVTVDGEVRGVTPLTVRLDAGAHVLEVQSGKAEPRVIPLTITAGVQTAQYVELQGLTGALEIRSEPAGARVSIDGQPRGTAPMTVSNLSPGDHTVVLEAGGRKVTQAVRIEAGITAQLVVPMRR